MKEKIKKKSFWFAVAGALVLILQLLGVRVDIPHVNEVVGAVCALLIILGLITDDTKAGKDEVKPLDDEDETDAARL